jgi:hypothetical protein
LFSSRCSTISLRRIYFRNLSPGSLGCKRSLRSTRIRLQGRIGFLTTNRYKIKEFISKPLSMILCFIRKLLQPINLSKDLLISTKNFIILIRNKLNTKIRNISRLIKLPINKDNRSKIEIVIMT